jgi:hypothetical protein
MLVVHMQKGVKLLIELLFLVAPQYLLVVKLVVELFWLEIAKHRCPLVLLSNLQLL